MKERFDWAIDGVARAKGLATVSIGSLAVAAAVFWASAGCSSSSAASAPSDAGTSTPLTSATCSAQCFAGELCLWQDQCGVGGTCDADPPTTEKCISAAPCKDCNCLSNYYGLQTNCGGCAFNPEAGYFFMYCWAK